ncbi:dienelactone hydrolase family [Vibrio variabilis]|uniref:Dienelactone hydrolase family n=1 Tax=Vibrio variabilis TaxID=990271 RepID=A0ABQ0J7N2_9VIBR|nr:dienelactone hydrolase family [Vibrio variabilis]
MIVENFLSLGGLVALGFTMTTLTSALIPNYAAAEQVSFNDPAIKATYVKFDSPKGHGEGQGYLVVPKDLQVKAPVVLVIHENRGLNPYIKDVARRLAMRGLVAFAPDALFPLVGTLATMTKVEQCRKAWTRPKLKKIFLQQLRF